MTPKQDLLAHLERDHGVQRQVRSGVRATWTHDQLAVWHARQHHHYRTSHYHRGCGWEGERDADSDSRRGWRTGADVVYRGAR